MKTFLWWFVAITAAFPLVLGAIVTATGFGGMALLFGIDSGASAGPTLDSNLRFLAANFLGMGLVMVWILRDLGARLAPLKIVFATILIGGVARVTSMTLHGSPGPLATFLMGVELTAPVLGLWLVSRIASRHGTTA